MKVGINNYYQYLFKNKGIFPEIIYYGIDVIFPIASDKYSEKPYIFYI